MRFIGSSRSADTMLSHKQILCLFFLIFMSTQINGNRIKRMYAMCPPKFIRIGSECYFISTERVNWLDAHFECKDRNSRLAEPFKQEDRYLRKYLYTQPGPKHSDIWIGGRFNWERNKWQWGYNGKDVTYQSFSQLSGDRKNLKFHCATLKPELKYRWSAESCVESHQYICQHRMPYVSAKNRQRVYNRWNETFPNEMANEIEVIVSKNDSLSRRQRMHRQHQKRPNRHPNKNEQNPRQENALPFNELAQSAKRPIYQNPDNSIRGTRMDNNRQRNEINRQTFELKLNRHQAGGIRKRMQFNRTDASFRPKASTIRTTTTTTQLPTTTSQPMTASYWTPGLTDEQLFEKQQEERERLRYESQQRRIAQEQKDLQRLEKQRADEENRAREKHQRELQRRQDQLELERKEMVEDERIREEKRRQNELNNLRNEQNRRKLQETQQKMEEMRQRQTEQELLQIKNDHDQRQHEIQTNEIDLTTTTTSTTTETSLKLKKEKLNRIRDRLSHMSPDQQHLFFKQREERKKRKNGKRNIEQQKTT